MRQSALVMLVPAAEPTVRDFRARYDPAAAAGIMAHITLLTPFVPPDEIDAALRDELAAFFLACEPFPFAFRRTGRFPDTVFLAPEPAALFRRIVEALVDCFPGYPPYEGEFEDIIPHLTVAHGAGEGVLDAIATAVRMNLPVEAYADEACLMAGEVAGGRAVAGTWEELARFPFAG